MTISRPEHSVSSLFTFSINSRERSIRTICGRRVACIKDICTELVNFVKRQVSVFIDWCKWVFSLYNCFYFRNIANEEGLYFYRKCLQNSVWEKSGFVLCINCTANTKPLRSSSGGGLLVVVVSRKGEARSHYKRLCKKGNFSSIVI